MVGSNVLIKVAALFGPVGAVRTLELRLLATLVPGVSDQCRAMLVTLAAGFATIRKVDPLGHPEAGQILDQRHHRIVAVPLVALRHSHARKRRNLCKSQGRRKRGTLVDHERAKRFDSFWGMLFVRQETQLQLKTSFNRDDTQLLKVFLSLCFSFSTFRVYSYAEFTLTDSRGENNSFHCFLVGIAFHRVSPTDAFRYPLAINEREREMREMRERERKKNRFIPSRKKGTV